MWMLVPGLLLVAAPVVFVIFGRSFIAGAMISAPNARKVLDVAGDSDARRLAELGVYAQLRVEVADPPASLSVWLLEPPSPPRGTVLVLHGIRSEKYWMLGLARLFSRAGYRAVLIDSRGHGRSTGDVLSYGVFEARDASLVLDALGARGLLAGGVGAVGTSYGAATAIELSGIDPRVRAVVAIAPFSSLHDVVPVYVARFLPGVSRLLPNGFVDEAIAEAGRRGGFDPRAASPLAAMAHTSARVLLIHGQDDDHIPSSQSVALHAAAPDRSELVLVAGEDHVTINSDRTHVIADRGVEWMRRYLDGALR